MCLSSVLKPTAPDLGRVGFAGYAPELPRRSGALLFFIPHVSYHSGGEPPPVGLQRDALASDRVAARRAATATEPPKGSRRDARPPAQQTEITQNTVILCNYLR